MERRRIPLRAAGALISRRAALPRSLAEWRAELAPRAAFLAQSLVLLLVLLFFWRILSNAIGNLEQQNIASGFGFLNSTAGFAVNQALIPYSEESSYGRLLIVGLLNTLLVSALGIALASVLGFVIGIARLSSNWIVARLAAAYVEIVRNIPLLLQIFFWYFAFLGALPSPRSAAGWMESVYAHNRGIVLPKPVWEEGSALTLQLLLLALILCPLLLRFARWRRETTGSRPAWIQSALIALLLAPLAAFLLTGAPISLDYPELKGFNFEGGITISREFLALLLALSLYTAAYIAEIVRAGLLAVQRGQVEAARAIGLKTPQTLRLVVIPQAMQVIIPPLTNQYLNLTKNSSLAAAIAYPDLVSVFAGTALNQTGQAIEILFITMCVYLSLSVLTSIAMNQYNARLSRRKKSAP